MYRQEVIELMTKAINDMNRSRGIEMGVREEELDHVISTMANELNNVNAMLYDLLVDNGVIRS
jgi:flagellin-like hook-associated protein FlgL